MAKRAPLEIALVDVRDLELAPAGGRETLYDLEHATVVEVATGYGQVALGIRRLLDDARNPILP
jgi:hypothetical protein